MNTRTNNTEAEFKAGDRCIFEWPGQAGPWRATVRDRLPDGWYEVTFDDAKPWDQPEGVVPGSYLVLSEQATIDNPFPADIGHFVEGRPRVLPEVMNMDIGIWDLANPDPDANDLLIVAAQRLYEIAVLLHGVIASREQVATTAVLIQHAQLLHEMSERGIEWEDKRLSDEALFGIDQTETN